VFVKPFISKPVREVAIPHGIASAIQGIDHITYKHIGVAIDFSANDHAAIKHALMQGGKQATYTLIHVVETAGARYHGTQVMDYETQSDHDNMQLYVDELKTLGYNSEARIGYGSRANAIASVVNTDKVDFLVMGSHGHKAIKDLIYGTTVDTVRHLVNIPVLVVKQAKK